MGLNLNTPETRNYTRLNAVPSGSTAEPDYSVKYVQQSLTEPQKAQARENIGAAAAGEGGVTINEFHFNRQGTTDAFTYEIAATGYEPKVGDLMIVVFDWPFFQADYNPVILRNGTTNPTVYLKNAHQMATDYDEMDAEVNSRWTVRFEQVEGQWYAYNISTQVQADWNTVSRNAPSYIKNKPAESLELTMTDADGNVITGTFVLTSKTVTPAS